MSTIEQVEPTYEGWALVELMGHRRTAGKVTEVELAGAKVLRVDTPNADGETVATQFYGGSALYCLTPCEEETVMKWLNGPERWGLPDPVRLALPKPQDEDSEELPF